MRIWRCLLVSTLLLASVEAPAAPPRIAIVIDDLGNHLQRARQLIARDEPISVSILPDTPFATTLARDASARGKAVMLHLPMRAGGPGAREPRWLDVDTSRLALSDLLRAGMAAVPDAVGVNNHQGSVLTGSLPAMRQLMLALRSRGLFFLDSRTTARTVAGRAACEYQVPFAERDVFLDNDPSPDAISAAFLALERRARQQGSAIGIGHPHPATLAVLYRWLDELPGRGIHLVSVTELIHAFPEEGPSWHAC